MLNDSPAFNCTSCAQPVQEAAKFCPHCGAYQEEVKEGTAFQTEALRAVLIYYFATLLICLVAQLDSVISDVYDLMVLYVIDAITTIIFVAINFREIIALLDIRKVKPLLMLGLVVGAFAGAIVVNVFADSVNRSLFNEEYYYYYFYNDSLSNPVTWMVGMIAVFPAFFEEVAFRGFLHSYINKLVDYRATLIITAFLFALMHLNFFSFIWLFPFGWLLAWLRHKHNTLWYGIVFHFVFNLIAILYELRMLQQL